MVDAVFPWETRASGTMADIGRQVQALREERDDAMRLADRRKDEAIEAALKAGEWMTRYHTLALAVLKVFAIRGGAPDSMEEAVAREAGGICDVCLGAGQVDADIECEACDGTGGWR